MSVERTTCHTWVTILKMSQHPVVKGGPSHSNVVVNSIRLVTNIIIFLNDWLTSHTNNLVLGLPVGWDPILYYESVGFLSYTAVSLHHDDVNQVLLGGPLRLQLSYVWRWLSILSCTDVVDKPVYHGIGSCCRSSVLTLDIGDLIDYKTSWVQGGVSISRELSCGWNSLQVDYTPFGVDRSTFLLIKGM